MMKPKTYSVLSMAVENGVRYGISRAHKHVENPTPEQLETTIYEAVINEICEWFNIEEQHAE